MDLMCIFQSQKTQGFCVADFATLSDERRSRSKIFPLFIWINEPCVRKFEGLARSKLLGISQTNFIWGKKLLLGSARTVVITWVGPSNHKLLLGSELLPGSKHIDWSKTLRLLEYQITTACHDDVNLNMKAQKVFT